MRLTFRDFPLPNHAQAFKAAEAAQCAQDQDRFWEYHDRLFANQSALQLEHLKRYAAEMGLDAATFNACLDDGKYTDRVRQDYEEGQAMGVAATPTFFINGRLLSGAQPFEAFRQVIDEELARR